jgi:hypothetical protein
MPPLLPAGGGFPPAARARIGRTAPKEAPVSQTLPDPRDPEAPPPEDEDDRRDEQLEESFPSSDPPSEGGPGV